MRRTLLCAVLGATLLGMAIPSFASAGSVAGNFYYAIGSSPSFSPSTTETAQRDSYVILQAWKSSLAAQLKAANPNLKVLVYQDASAMSNGGRVDGWASSGVGYDEADTAHPDWFLLNPSGNRIPESGWPWLYLADIGNAGYQQQWADNVVRLLNSGPWDGVFLDDTNPTVKYHTSVTNVAKYPSDSAYQGAMRSFLQYVGPRLRATGKLAIPNMGAWVEYPTVIASWLQYVDGGMDEMFDKWSTTPGEGYRDPVQWKTELGEIQTAEAQGKKFLAVTQAATTDTQAQRYGWGSVLLGSNGNASFYASYDQQSEPWLADYDADLGSPTSSAVALSNGAYKRTFTKGLVVVNPTGSTQHVDFGGTYSGDGLSNATAADLGSKTALILTSPAGSVPPPVAPEPTGPTGPTGSTGTTGSTGSTGSTTGSTGSTSGSTSTTGSTSTGTSPAPPAPSGGSGSTTTKPPSHHKRRARTSRRSVRTHHRASHVVVKARAACSRSAYVRLKVDGRTVMRRRGGGRNYRARLSLPAGTHRVALTTRGCGHVLSARRVHFA